MPEMAAELAAGRVGIGRGPAGASGTGAAVNPLVRWLVVGRCGTGRDTAPTAHNPEVEGSNPSPATKLDQHVWRFTSFAKGQPDVAVVSHLSVDGPDFGPGLSLGLEPSRIRLATVLAAWASMPGMTWL